MVLLKHRLDNKIKSDAKLIIARSAIKIGNEEKAREAYAQVQKIIGKTPKKIPLYSVTIIQNRTGRIQSSFFFMISHYKKSFIGNYSIYTHPNLLYFHL